MGIYIYMRHLCIDGLLALGDFPSQLHHFLDVSFLPFVQQQFLCPVALATHGKLFHWTQIPSDLWMNSSQRAGNSCLAYSCSICHFYFRDFFLMCLLISCSWAWPGTYFNKPVPYPSCQQGRTGWRKWFPDESRSSYSKIILFFQENSISLSLSYQSLLFTLVFGVTEADLDSMYGNALLPSNPPEKHYVFLSPLVSPALKALVYPQRQALGKQKLKGNRGEEVDRNRDLKGWQKIWRRELGTQRKRKWREWESKNFKLIYILARFYTQFQASQD